MNPENKVKVNEEYIRAVANVFMDCIMDKLQDYELIEWGFDDEGNEIVVKTYSLSGYGAGKAIYDNHRRIMLQKAQQRYSNAGNGIFR